MNLFLREILQEIQLLMSQKNRRTQATKKNDIFRIRAAQKYLRAVQTLSVMYRTSKVSFRVFFGFFCRVVVVHYRFRTGVHYSVQLKNRDKKKEAAVAAAATASRERGVTFAGKKRRSARDTYRFRPRTRTHLLIGFLIESHRPHHHTDSFHHIIYLIKFYTIIYSKNNNR